MLANINVVTRSPVDAQKLRVSSETGSGGERKLSVSSGMYLGAGANLLVSASVFNNSGLSFPGQALGLGSGSVSGVDGERGYHTFAQLIWHNWSFTGYFNSRRKQPPLGVGTSVAGDSAQQVTDGRDLLSASYKRRAGPGEWRWQVAYDAYRYRDRYDYREEESVTSICDFNRGDWLNSQLTWEVPVRALGPLTLGVAGFWEIRNLQYNIGDGVPQERLSHPDRGAAIFAQQEWRLSPSWKLDGGLRIDVSRNFPHFISPRLAVVYQPSPRTAFKLVYGRPFRNPSAFEQYYNDGGLAYAAAQPLHPETAHTFEGSLEHQLSRGVALVVNGFHYRIDRVIDAAAFSDDVLQYRNSGGLRSTGLELELNGRFDLFEMQASTTFQTAEGGPPWTTLANSPANVSKLRVGVPVARERLFLSGALGYVSSRKTQARGLLGGPLLADFTATVRLSSRFDLVSGLRNTFDRRYEDPIFLTLDRLRGDGRSVFLKLVWRVWE
jgi:outer membrane receptor protein involved in Fe transport